MTTFFRDGRALSADEVLSELRVWAAKYGVSDGIVRALCGGALMGNPGDVCFVEFLLLVDSDYVEPDDYPPHRPGLDAMHAVRRGG